MRRGIILLSLVAASLTFGYIVGYITGKRAADHYYAEHPVTLIQPIKLRAPEPVASIEEPK